MNNIHLFLLLYVFIKRLYIPMDNNSRGYLRLSWMLAVWPVSPRVSFVLAGPRKRHMVSTPTKARAREVRMPFTFHRKCIWCKSAVADFQEHRFTHFIVNQTERDGLKGNFFFTHSRRSEKAVWGTSELAALDISHSAFCVHSIVSALIITHARVRLLPQLPASPFILILSQ